VFSGQTYYLDRPYRRADPFVSGVVDWRRINTGAKLDSLLAAGGYSYVIYHDRDWKLYPGGTSTMSAVGDAYRSGLLRKTKVFDEKLYTSRFMRQYKTSHVYVLERARNVNEPGLVSSRRPDHPSQQARDAVGSR